MSQIDDDGELVIGLEFIEALCRVAGYANELLDAVIDKKSVAKPARGLSAALEDLANKVNIQFTTEEYGDSPGYFDLAQYFDDVARVELRDDNSLVLYYHTDKSD